MTLQLGYRFDLEDRAALASDSAPYARLLSSGEWTYADPRPWTPTGWWHIRNQANMGSCRGHSLAANARLCGYLKAGKLDLDDDGTKNEPLEDDFSPMWCYLMSQRESGIRGDSGATIDGGRKVGVKHGVCREVSFPYPSRYTTSIPRGAANDAARFKFARETLFEAGDAEKVFDWIGSGQGAFDWGKIWPLPFVKGCLLKGMSKSERGGGHATAGIGLIRGEDLIRDLPQMKSEVKPDEPLLVCANSHSTRAQHAGFYYVTLNGLNEALEHRHTTGIGLSDLSIPEVRRLSFLKRSQSGVDRS